MEEKGRKERCTCKCRSFRLTRFSQISWRTWWGKCKTTKTIIERIRKVLIDEYIKIFENHINKLIRDKNSIEYKKQYFNQDIDENLLKSINDKINVKQQKINILYQFIEDKKNKKEENIKILQEEKKNNIEELKTELSFFQPDY